MSIATQIGTKLASGVVATSLLLAGATVAFAQTPSTGTNGTSGTLNGTTGTGTTSTGTTGTSGTTDTSGTTGTGMTNTGTPGVPNTGAGGSLAVNLALLATTGILAVGSGIYLSRQKFLTR